MNLEYAAALEDDIALILYKYVSYLKFYKGDVNRLVKFSLHSQDEAQDITVLEDHTKVA